VYNLTNNPIPLEPHLRNWQSEYSIRKRAKTLERYAGCNVRGGRRENITTMKGVTRRKQLVNCIRQLDNPALFKFGESIRQYAVIRCDKGMTPRLGANWFARATNTGINHHEEYCPRWKVPISVEQRKGCLADILWLDVVGNVNEFGAWMNGFDDAFHHANVDVTVPKICQESYHTT
jgi:hypothetical protein